jgi:hypothetical protein
MYSLLEYKRNKSSSVVNPDYTATAVAEAAAMAEAEAAETAAAEAAAMAAGVGESPVKLPR